MEAAAAAVGPAAFRGSCQDVTEVLRVLGSQLTVHQNM